MTMSIITYKCSFCNQNNDDFKLKIFAYENNIR